MVKSKVRRDSQEKNMIDPFYKDLIIEIMQDDLKILYILCRLASWDHSRERNGTRASLFDERGIIKDIEIEIKKYSKKKYKNVKLIWARPRKKWSKQTHHQLALYCGLTETGAKFFYYLLDYDAVDFILNRYDKMYRYDFVRELIRKLPLQIEFKDLISLYRNKMEKKCKKKIPPIITHLQINMEIR